VKAFDSVYDIQVLKVFSCHVEEGI